MNTSPWNHRLAPAIPFILLPLGILALWQFAVSAAIWPPYIIPSPRAVLDYLARNFANGSLIQATATTLSRLLLGYAIGLLAGIPLGILAARFPLAGKPLGILALGLQALPSVCWVPLACIWFGQSQTALLFVVVMGTVWSVILSTENGIRLVPPIYDRAARVMGSSGWHTLTRVTLPSAAPHIISGMKQGWAFAWRSLMAAEIYVTVFSGFGLGQFLHYGRELNRMHQVVAIMALIILIGLLTDKALFSPIERHLHRKWGINQPS